MNRPMVERHLREAEQHISRGEHRIAQQHEIIAELRRDGHDTTQAEELLAILSEAQHQHIATRERLLTELQAAAMPLEGA